MRTEPVRPVAAKSSDDSERTPAAPRREGRQAFEAALRRAGRGPLGGEADAEAAVPTEPLLPRAAQPAAEAPAARWAPHEVPAADAATRRLQASVDAGPLPQQWQLQIVEPGQPVQRLEVQRNAAGPWNVVLAAPADSQHSASTARLRQRLARAGSTARLDFRPPAHEDEP